MKRLILILCLISTSSWASEDITCQKNLNHAFVVTCEAKKVMNVSLVNIDGGECAAPAFHWHGTGKFDVPGTQQCFYVRSVTLNIDGHKKAFGPL
jgi:hypothetical protein